MKIAVFTEKHGNRYMKASTDEELQESCLKVLRERMADGYWYYDPDEPTKPVCSREDAEKLPDPFRETALEAWKIYDRKFRQYKKDEEWLKAARDEIENSKGWAAKLLGRRRDCEYEGFEIVKVE